MQILFVFLVYGFVILCSVIVTIVICVHWCQEQDKIDTPLLLDDPNPDSSQNRQNQNEVNNGNSQGNKQTGQIIVVAEHQVHINQGFNEGNHQGLNQQRGNQGYGQGNNQRNNQGYNPFFEERARDWQVREEDVDKFNGNRYDNINAPLIKNGNTGYDESNGYSRNF